MKKRILHIARNNILLLLAGTAFGLAALFLVHLLPVQPMQEHVYRSLEMIKKEFVDEVMIEGYNSTLTGNFTDCLMLEHAVYKTESHSIWEQILHMYRSESCEDENYWWPGYSLNDYLEKTPQPREVEYARYWHGYLVVLKPLLLLTSLNTLRLLNSALQLLLAGSVVMSFCQKKASSLAIGFLLSLPFLFFVSTYASLSLSICFYIMVVTLLIQLKFESYFHKKGIYGEFFLIIGMATSYFDFLTYPLVTLVFPLCVYLYFHNESLGRSVRKMVQHSVQWLVGYMGLWASKWILSDLFTNSSTISDAVNTLQTRTYSAAGCSRIIGFFRVVKKNIQPYSNWCFIILTFIALVMLLSGIVKQGIKRENIQRFISYILLALYPLVWFFVTQNHSEQHWQFTCRILACSVFAAYVGCSKLGGEVK